MFAYQLQGADGHKIKQALPPEPDDLLRRKLPGVNVGIFMQAVDLFPHPSIDTAAVGKDFARPFGPGQRPVGKKYRPFDL